jgi:hypothetical protein
MRFVGIKRTITVDENYGQVKELGQFWAEMEKLYPNESLLGLGTNWRQNKLDYYIGKINEDWQPGTEVLELPDDDWQESSCELSNKAIELMYRKIYSKGKLDYEIESTKDGIFTTKVHYKRGRENEI